MTLVHLSRINFASSFIFCLQSIIEHRLIKIWKTRIRKIFSNIRLRKRFRFVVLLCQKNRSFRYTKSQIFFIFHCSQNFHQNFHFCNQDFHLHDFELFFRLHFRRFFDFRFQITFVAFVSIISIFAMICSIIHVSINDILEIVDRWKKYKKNNRFETKFEKKKIMLRTCFEDIVAKLKKNTWLEFWHSQILHQTFRFSFVHLFFLILEFSFNEYRLSILK